MAKGHGEYREIASEKDFFGEVKESKNVVCHFYKSSTFRYKYSYIRNTHLRKDFNANIKCILKEFLSFGEKKFKL